MRIFDAQKQQFLCGGCLLRNREGRCSKLGRNDNLAIKRLKSHIKPLFLLFLAIGAVVVAVAAVARCVVAVVRCVVVVVVV